MKISLKPKQKLPDIQLYESLDELWLYNWSKMQEKNDVNWLRIDFDGRQPKIKDDRLDKLKKDFEDEYFILWDDDKFKEALEKRNEIAYYIALYQNVKVILQRMRLGIMAGIGDGDVENVLTLESRLIFIKQLAKLNYKMPELNSVYGDLEELNRLDLKNEGVKTKIQMLSDDIETDGKKITRRLNVELANVSNILGYSHTFNAKEITVADWIDFQKLAIQEIEKRKRTQTNE